MSIFSKTVVCQHSKSYLGPSIKKTASILHTRYEPNIDQPSSESNASLVVTFQWLQFTITCIPFRPCIFVSPWLFLYRVAQPKLNNHFTIITFAC